MHLSNQSKDQNDLCQNDWKIMTIFDPYRCFGISSKIVLSMVYGFLSKDFEQ